MNKQQQLESRKPILNIVRKCLRDMYKTGNRLCSDRRVSDHPSNIFGRQMKFLVWENEKNLKALKKAIDTKFDAENMSYVAVIKNATRTTHSGYRPALPAIQIQRK